MRYTKPMTFNTLLNELSDIAKTHNLEVKAYKFKRDDADGKVTTQITIKESSGAEAEFYDYKATNYYDKSQPSPTKLRKSEYEYHMQSNSQLLMSLFNNILQG